MSRVCSTVVLVLVTATTTSASLEEFLELFWEDAMKDDLPDYPNNFLNTTLGSQEDGPPEYLKVFLGDQEGSTGDNSDYFLRRIMRNVKASTTRMEREMEENIKEICSCFKTPFPSQSCTRTLLSFGTIILNGKCIGGNIRRRRQQNQRREVENTPQSFGKEEEWCQGFNRFIFVSSGRKTELKISSASSLIICHKSIKPHLEHLTISSVQEIKVSPEAIMPRSINLMLHLTNIRHKFTLLQNGFLVKNNTYNQPIPNNNLELNDVPLPPVEVQLVIDTAEEVEFKTGSLVAPRLSVSLINVSRIHIDPQAIISYSHPQASSLKVNQSKSLILETLSTRIGNFKATDINQITLKEKSLAMIPDGGAISLEYIGNAILYGSALTLSPSMSLTLRNVSIASASRRSIIIDNTTLGSLRFLYLQNVRGANLESGALCLVAENVMTQNLVLETENNTIAVCIQDESVEGERELRVWNGAILCTGRRHTNLLCNDPRCASCLPQLSASTIDFPAPSYSSSTSASDSSFTKVDSPESLGNHNETDSLNSSVPHQDIGGMLLYPVIILIIVAGISILTVCCICKLRKRNRSAKYELPQPVPSCTFQRNIVTADTLSRTEQLDINTISAEIYVPLSESQFHNRQELPSDASIPPINFHLLPATDYRPPTTTDKVPDDEDTLAETNPLFNDPNTHGSNDYEPNIPTPPPNGHTLSDFHTSCVDSYELSADAYTSHSDGESQQI
ncbi:uncharacterized protein LOC121875773 isoform X2 [Homarus americanus]|uniref:uncharacterized protein LOC121875773 isoform X2 n=1 Tax=Homarus americanus TaxID=6706 RepID=UPI001C477B11|nr:uncharacterized protein LOC121875773 isoform X2 [Homarus americanus]